jgi:REP-associated tyrosine transposase
VWTRRKRLEKLDYMHQNPVKRGLVTAPDLWTWSSFRFYALGEEAAVRINSTDILSPVDIGPHLKKSA